MGKIISILRVIVYTFIYFLLTGSLSYVIERYNHLYTYLTLPIIYLVTLVLLVLVLKIKHVNKFFISKSLLLISILLAILIWKIGDILSHGSFQNEKYDVTSIISYCITYIFLAPLVLQLFFNKLLLNILIDSKINIFLSILLIGLLFVFVNGSIFFINQYQILLLILDFVFCIVSSLIYVKSKSLVYPILYNSVFNICAICAKYLIN